MKAFYIYVGTAGIGRMSWGAWSDLEKIDRADGDDRGTHESLLEALRDVAAFYTARIMSHAFTGHAFKWPKLRTAKEMAKHSNVRCVMITYDSPEYVAEWMGYDVKRGFHRVSNAERADEYPHLVATGETLVSAVELLAINTQNELAHARWVDEDRQ